MWKREVNILWALKKENKTHANVCRLEWVCRDKLTIALAPVFDSSCSLSQCIRGGETHHVLTNHRRFRIVEKVADALRFLHKRGFSHNDVQPSNVVLGPHPEDDVLLVDFGQAFRFSGDEEGQVATNLLGINTPLRYAPPEVLGREKLSSIRGEVRDTSSTIL